MRVSGYKRKDGTRVKAHNRTGSKKKKKMSYKKRRK